MRAWLAARAVPGVEVVESDRYARTCLIGDRPAALVVSHLPERAAFAVEVDAGGVPVSDAVVHRVSRVLDLDRDPEEAGTPLREDPWMAQLLARHRGLRVPGGWDPFELAVRAVLGQQVTVVAARRLAGDLVALCGHTLPEPRVAPGVLRLFPTAAQVAAADLGGLRMPAARRATLQALAETVLRDASLFEPGPLEMIVTRLRRVRGIGDWTAHYIALRALRTPDAFPASDVGLLRGAARETGTRPTPANLLSRAEAWRPHRAYAAQLLWAEDGTG